jgi:hypothetical protein
LLVLAIALGILAGLAAAIGLFPEESLTDRELSGVRRLESLSTSAAAGELERLADEGDVGLGVAVAAMGSRQKALAEAARRVVLDRATSWQALPGDAGGARLSLLIRALARHVESFSPAVRQLAADLAGAILESEPASATSGGELGEECEELLWNVARLNLEEPAGGAPAARRRRSAAAELEEPPGDERTLSEIARLPGEGLSAEPRMPPEPNPSSRAAVKARAAVTPVPNALPEAAPEQSSPGELTPTEARQIPAGQPEQRSRARRPGRSLRLIDGSSAATEPAPARRAEPPAAPADPAR